MHPGRMFSHRNTLPAIAVGVNLFFARSPLHASDSPMAVFPIAGHDPMDAFIVLVLAVALLVVVVLRLQLKGRNERLQSELQQRIKLENQLTELIESANDVIFSLDENFRFVSFNHAGELLTGYSRRQLIGKNFNSLFTDGQPSVDFDQLKHEPTCFEMNFRSPTGKLIIWEVSSRPTLRPDNELVIHCIARDVTERKNAAEELRRLYVLQTQQLENSPLAFIEWDERFRVLRWSKTAEAIFGWASVEVIGKTPEKLNLVHPEDKGEVTQLTGSMRDGMRSNSRSSNRNLTKDGRIIHVEWYNSTLKDPAGKVISMMSLAHDVTDRITEEENRRRLEEQVRQAQKMEAVGRLAGGVAHDFNNLLTVINGCSELMLRETSSHERLHELSNEIRSAGEQAVGLTRQLLGFARREITNPVSLELNVVVRDVEKMLRRLIGEHIELVADLDPECGRVKADPGHMVQLLMNLAVNSRDAMPRGGRLTVVTRNCNESQMIEVTDSGIGMDSETRAHIFEPFFTTKPVGQATGIGLATVHSIIERANARVEVESEPGMGTTFRIYFPTCYERSPAKATGYSRRPDLRVKETILLVEDEELVRSLTQRVLEGKGYRVFAAPCPADALDLHARVPGKVDMVLTDVVMPGMGGRELTERLREIQPDIKVLFMSGYTSDEVLRQGIHEEQVHFIQKPFSPDGLLRKVREVLIAPVSEAVLV